MKNTSLLRPRVAVPVILLLTVLAIAMAFSLDIVANSARFCGSSTAQACASWALRYAPWLPTAQIVLAAGAALVAMIGAPLARRPCVISAPFGGKADLVGAKAGLALTPYFSSGKPKTNSA